MQTSTLANHYVLIVSHNQALQRQLAQIFGQVGAYTFRAVNQDNALRILQSSGPTLIVLDLDLPNLDIPIFCRSVRQQTAVPLIMLADISHDASIALGLRLGANSYLLKPINVDIFISQAVALIDQMVLNGSDRDNHSGSGIAYDDGYLVVDFTGQRVMAHQEMVDLTSTEFALLALLVKHANQLLTWDEILSRVWGPAYTDSHHYVHTYLARLRLKVEPDPKKPVYLITRRGRGCLFQPLDNKAAF
ncbi:MAG: response regulator transcription factor [Chloroflexota bacterium]